MGTQNRPKKRDLSEFPAGLLPGDQQRLPAPAPPQPGPAASTRLLPSCPTPRPVFRECPRFKPTNIRLQPRPEGHSRGADTARGALCEPRAMGVLQRRHHPSLGACSSQTPKCPAAPPRALGLLHAVTPVPGRAAPASAVFHARLLQATRRRASTPPARWLARHGTARRSRAPAPHEKGSWSCRQRPHPGAQGKP